MVRLINLVAPSVGLRQGDVLSLIGGEVAPYGAGLCVVITADCDLAQGKHYGHVLLCPIVPASAYYEHIWCAKRLETFKEKTLGRLRKELDELFDRGVLKSPLSDQALGIICESEVAVREALSALEISPGKIEDLAHLVAALEKCRADCGNLHALASGSAHSQKKDVSDIRGKLFADFKTELGRDAVDVVVIHDDLSGDDVVHVVLLRAPFSVPAQHIGLLQTDKVGATCIRVGRFAPEIKFLISNKFGTLFSRVGMKRELEIDRNAAIELLRDCE